jgi:hypothetical protein
MPPCQVDKTQRRREALQYLWRTVNCNVAVDIFAGMKLAEKISFLFGAVQVVRQIVICADLLVSGWDAKQIVQDRDLAWSGIEKRFINIYD